jgi:homoserine kinase
LSELPQLSEGTGTPCACVTTAELPAAVTMTAAHEIHGVAVTLVGAGICISCIAPSTGAPSARQTALRALGARQCCTATILEVLAGRVARCALRATVSGAGSAGFTRCHALEALLELIARVAQRLGEIRAVRADLIAHGATSARVTGDRFTALHQLLALRHDICVVLAELANRRCGTADIVGRGWISGRGRCGCATRDQK